MYVGNDPTNGVDPTGLYGQGDGWEDKDWRKFEKAQSRVAARMEKAAGRLDSAIQSGGKTLSKETKRFEKVFGEGTGTVENMQAVASTLSSMAAALRDDGTDGYIANALTEQQTLDAGASSKNVLGFADPDDRFTININIEHDDFKDASALRWTVGHETGHNFGLSHPTVNGVTPYVMYATKGSLNAYKNLTPQQALKNPDRFMRFGYGMYPK